MFKIQTLNNIAEVGLQQFPKNIYEISSDVYDPDAILLRSYNLHDTNIPSSVNAVGRAGAGINNVPVQELTRRGIPVFNTPGANANAVRELVLAGMLIASRNICVAWQYVNALNDEHDFAREIELNKKRFVGTELLGKTLGVVGLGSIGVKVANAAIHLGMHVIGYDPTISVNRAWELSANVQQAHNLEYLLSQSDYMTFHVPLTPDTKNMINGDKLKFVKDNAIILNFARDGIIDTDALLNALNTNKVSTYVTDFPNKIFKNHSRVIHLPHLGASTKEAEENCAVMIAKQVREFLELGSINNSANFPSIEVARNKDETRLVIVNANIPNMVAQISTKLASEGLNITSLVNKSREEIACTIIDVNSDVTGYTLQQISAIDGIIQVRKINPS